MEKAFVENLERAFAEEDNAQFDLQRLRRAHRRRNLRDKILVSAGILVLTATTFYVYGLFIFSHMPEPV